MVKGRPFHIENRLASLKKKKKKKSFSLFFIYI